MPVKLLCAAMLLVFSVVGCANQVPVAENFSLSTQKKLRAPHHWDVIANDVVSETKKALISNEYIKNRPVYVDSSQADATVFNVALRDFIITRLVKNGIVVTEDYNDSIKVKYHTQVVRHLVDRKYSPLLSKVLVARNLQEEGHSEDYGPLASCLTDGPTDTELIVNTSIIEDGIYHMRKSDVYYIDGEDIRLFLPPPTIKTKDFKVVG